MAISSAASGCMRIRVWIVMAVALLLSACYGDQDSTPAAPQYTVSYSGDHLSFGQASPQSVISGTAFSLAVTADIQYTKSTTVGGTCPAGAWEGNLYTTGAITANCTLVFSADINTFEVTASGSSLTINPSTPQTVDVGATQAFTVTASTNYTKSNAVGGTCAAGTWTGNVYTTGAITADCTVVFSAAINTFKVTASGSNLTINPSATQTVNVGATQQFTVTPDTGYTLANAVTGTCASGAFTGSTYTTGAVTADCTVIFSAVPTHNAGDCLGGGVIFYVNSDPNAPAGRRGLIAALSDAPVGPVIWGTLATLPTTLVTQPQYFTGLTNTSALLSIPGIDAPAVSAANSYTTSENCDTCTPWYLPSQDELTVLFDQSDTIGPGFWTACNGTGFSSDGYWSSTQNSAIPTSTWLALLYTTVNTGASFSTTGSAVSYRVRAVRAF